MTVVSFTDYTPPPRYDARPWITARIEEAPTNTGPWAAIDTATLLPLDADPTVPQRRSFTTQLAAFTDGWYRIVWLDATGDASAPTEPVHNVADAGFTPTVAEVGALLHARTYAGGVEVGTFNDETRPTGDQVQILIDMAVGDILARLGGSAPSTYAGEVSRLAALQAASLVEASFFPDQLDTDRSAYRQYTAMVLAGIQNLTNIPEIGTATGAGGFASVPVVSPYVTPLL